LVDAKSILGQGDLALVSVADWDTQVSGTGKPADYADVTADQFTSALNTIDSAVANFNTRNDRSATAITTPTISGAGTAVDHTTNTDGSVDISLEWAWTGTNADIDGWFIFIRQSTSSSSYDIGTTPAEEVVMVTEASKRAVILFGCPANKYYTFGVQAYRVVDPDISATGYIKSTLVQPALAAEDPYRPSSSVAFAGDITGTLNGSAFGDLAIKDTVGTNDIANLAITTGKVADDNITRLWSTYASSDLTLSSADTNYTLGSITLTPTGDPLYITGYCSIGVWDVVNIDKGWIQLLIYKDASPVCYTYAGYSGYMDCATDEVLLSIPIMVTVSSPGTSSVTFYFYANHHISYGSGMTCICYDRSLSILERKK
jgi:hypothetical protein